MYLKDLLALFQTTVDPIGSTVVSFCDLVAVFGGRIRDRPSKAKPLSNRDAFLRYLRETQPTIYDSVIIPERYTSWLEFDKYSDLLLFEQDLSYLTSVVLVFLESFGAIAEFAAFSQIEVLRKRLLVVVSKEHFEARSFISLGPIRSVQKTSKQPYSICVIPSVTSVDLPVHVDAILLSLASARERTSATEAFDASKTQHQVLLLLDLINLFRVLQIEELQAVSRFFGVVADLKRISQLLFVLVEIKLVAEVPYGNSNYFVSIKTEDFISYKATRGRFNKAAFRARAEVVVGEDVHRRNAYRQTSL